ncbi:MAG: hypothetical protein ACJAT7_001337 [Psychromonas sp.]|jgi:hypothetical protein|uniref:sulfotransferase domain-containing protein n=1 Tax=Psychromonas sp. TaxID=1884585 RepID=UPI0039E6F44A
MLSINRYNKIIAEFKWLQLNARAQSKHLPVFMSEWLFRHSTARFRGIANCAIVGAQKAGSSSLYYYLNQHPQVKPTFGKELHYFTGSIIENLDTYAKGDIWYRAHFPLTRNLKENDICVDATPLYLFNPLAAGRIYRCNPNCKIIILLRDPVDRAISHYFHSKKMGQENLPIEVALAKEGERLKNALANKDYKERAYRVHSYQARGLYWQQIKNYLHYFSEEQLLFINSDDFFNDTAQTLKQVFEFLEVDENHNISDLSVKNVGDKVSNVSAEVYQQLSQYYRIPNQALFAGLNKTFDWR